MWIETTYDAREGNQGRVTSYIGVWIETILILSILLSFWVTSYIGVWIETMPFFETDNYFKVTSYIGVWIETGILLQLSQSRHILHRCTENLSKGDDWEEDFEEELKFMGKHADDISIRN